MSQLAADSLTTEGFPNIKTGIIVLCGRWQLTPLAIPPRLVTITFPNPDGIASQSPRLHRVSGATLGIGPQHTTRNGLRLPTPRSVVNQPVRSPGWQSASRKLRPSSSHRASGLFVGLPKKRNISSGMDKNSSAMISTIRLGGGDGGGESALFADGGALLGGGVGTKYPPF